MKKIEHTSTLYFFNSLKELPKADAELMKKAVEARKKAYAPYSNFQVGAAIRLENNKIVTGNNQENASYPSGLCAERTAIFAAGANYPNTAITKICISAASKNQTTTEPIPPCGACRQVIAEYELKQEKPITIYFMGELGKIAKSNSLENLLPYTFKKSFL